MHLVCRVSCLVSRVSFPFAFRLSSTFGHNTNTPIHKDNAISTLNTTQAPVAQKVKGRLRSMQKAADRGTTDLSFIPYRLWDTPNMAHPLLICPRGGVAQCDEQNPKCSGCIRRSISCVYLVCRDTRSSSSSDGGSFGRRFILSPHPAESTCFSSSSTVAKQGPQACLTLFTMGDLSLLHHWTLSTHLSISELDVKVGSLELM
jgi:hypothetical protein